MTLIFWVDGRPDAEKVLETNTGAVPRVGDQVQLGPYGGPYEWRRVVEVVWRHNTPVRGGVSVILHLDRNAVAAGEREPSRAKAGKG